MSPKEFALNAIAPYYANPELCALNEKNQCEYITNDGKKCVFGQFMLHPEDYSGLSISIAAARLLERQGEEILVEEARGILTREQWHYLQRMHDVIAVPERKYTIDEAVDSLGLFTMQELEEVAEKLKVRA